MRAFGKWSAWFCVVAAAAPAFASTDRATIDEPAAPTTLLLITLPVGTGETARLADQVSPNSVDGVEFVPLDRLSTQPLSSSLKALVERAQHATAEAKEAALGFELVKAARLRREAADELLRTGLLAVRPQMVAHYLLDAGAASGEAGARDLALAYFQKALAVDSDIRPGPEISPDVQKIFEAASALGPAGIRVPSDRILTELATGLGADGVVWIAAMQDDAQIQLAPANAVDGGVPQPARVSVVVAKKVLLIDAAHGGLDTRQYYNSELDDKRRWAGIERERVQRAIADAIGTGAAESDPVTPSAAQTAAGDSKQKPWYRRWWVYAIAGGVLVAGVGGIAIAAALQPETADVVVHH